MNVEKKLAKENPSEAEKWKGWHTCFRNEWEAIVLVQKPLVNNYLETIELNGIGALKTILSDGSFQSNILEGYSKGSDEKFDVHCTIKPLDLTRKLLETLVPLEKENIILDPFAGTGTTLVAAEKLGLDYIGIEIEPNYIEIIKECLADAEKSFAENSNNAKSKTVTDNKSKGKSATANQPAFW